MEKIIDKFKLTLLLVTIFLFPIFFLPTTQEFYQTNKFYLLGVTVLVMLLLAVLRFLFTRKITFIKTPFDAVLVFFLITQAISVALQSPNKVAGILALPTGVAFFLFVTFFFFIVTNTINKDKSRSIHNAFIMLAGIMSVATIILFFTPFNGMTLPSYLQFLQSPSFTPVGTKIELILVLGFFLVHLLVYFVKQLKVATATKSKKILAPGVILAVTAVALSLSIYATTQKPLKDDLTLKLPPLTTSWYAAVETLKSPTTALFGVGSDNFVSIFTRVKPATYNQSDLWQLNFNRSRSFMLHLWTETGVLGFVAFILMMVVAGRTVLMLRRDKNEHSDYFAAASLYMAVVLFAFPPSLAVLFLFFLLLALIGVESARAKKVSLDLNDITPAYLGISIVSLLGILSMFYLLSRAYMAEYYFKRSLNGLSSSNGRLAYDNLVKAIQANPYSETYHLTFSQINLLIANNIATRVVTAQKGGGTVSDQDRQTIAQAIQQAIVEAKAAVQLNSAKAQNWENLALIYRNIINVAQGGDSWTVASYQRAILSDPVNPQLRLNLGGVYYSLKNFPAAAQMFQQAIELKRDWANAHYNLAWAFYQNGNYPEAVASMQNVLSLVEKKNPDYTRAESELVEFRKKLPKKNEEASPSAQLTPREQQKLVLPKKPEPEISPKIALPENAQPPATGSAQPAGQ